MLPRELPSDIKQPRLLKALKKTGFTIHVSSGKGSHVQAVDPKSGKYITVQNHLYKTALLEILKSAEDLGYDAMVIMKNY